MISSVPGTYMPGSSFFHRIDARVKLVLLLVLTISLFLFHTWWPFLICAAVPILLALQAHLPFKRLLRMLTPVALILVLVLLAGSLRFDGSGTVALVGVVGFTFQGFNQSLMAVCRIVLMVLCTLLVSATTSSTAVADALLCMLAPLRRFKVPVDDVATALGLALRLLPVVAEQFDRVVAAQKARGASFSEGSLGQRLKAWIPVMIPLLVGLFRRSEALGLAMTARCYRGDGRTSLAAMSLTARDIVALIAGLVVCLGCILLFP